MAQRTIKIANIPHQNGQEHIKMALKQFGVIRVFLQKKQAFVQFSDLETLKAFQIELAKGNTFNLTNSHFEKVSSNFQWPMLEQQNEDDLSSSDQVTDLTEPKIQNLLIVSQCNEKILNSFSSERIKSQFFAPFDEINRILKKTDSVIIQFENKTAKDKFVSTFPEFKVSFLGENAYIDFSVQEIQNFSSLWIAQFQKENQQSKNQKVEILINQAKQANNDEKQQTKNQQNYSDQKDRIKEQESSEYIVIEQLSDENEGNALVNTQKQKVLGNNQKQNLNQMKNANQYASACAKIKKNINNFPQVSSYQNVKQNLQDFILNNKKQKLNNVIGPQNSIPILFWILILVSVFVLLLI